MALWSCRTPERNFDINLGLRPNPGEQAANAVFEARHGFIAAVPLSLVTDFSENIRSALNGVELVKNNPEDKIDPNAVGQFEYSVQQTTATPCIKSMAFGATQDNPPRLNMHIVFCGMKLGAVGARAALRFSPPFNHSPIVLDVSTIDFERSTTEFAVDVSIAPNFRRNGEIYLLNPLTTAGYEQLSDSSAYKIAVSWSGVEQVTGDTGKQIHEWREELIRGLFASMRSWVARALEHALERAVQNAVANVNKAHPDIKHLDFGIAPGNWAIAGASSYLGFTNFGDRLGIAGHVDLSLLRNGLPAHVDCKRNFVSPPAPTEYPVASIPGVFKKELTAPIDPELLPADPEVAKNAAMLIIPAATLNNLFWQFFGNSGECVFDLDLPQGVHGTYTASYAEPVLVEVAPPSAPYTSKTGVMVTMRFPAWTIKLSKELLVSMQQAGLQITGDATGALSVTISDYRHSMLLKTVRDSLQAIAHPILEPIYNEKYKDLAAFDIKKAFDFVKEHPPLEDSLGSTDILSAQQQVILMHHSLLDQFLKLTVVRDALKIANESKIPLEVFGVRAGSNALILNIGSPKLPVLPTIPPKALGPVTMALTPSPKHEPPAQPTPFSKFLDFFNLADSPPQSSEKVNWAAVTALLGQSPTAVRAIFQNPKTIFPENWRCKLEDIPGSLGREKGLDSFVSYAICGPDGISTWEVRWQFPRTVATNEDGAVFYLRVRATRALAPTDPGFTSVGQLPSESMPADAEKTLVDAAARWSWDVKTMGGVALAICGTIEICTDAAESKPLAVYEIWSRR